MDSFDYEYKVWGAHEVKLSPLFLGALRLRYCLEDLQTVSGKVLEVGCGAGAMARAIKTSRPDLDVYGCDISRRAINLARLNTGGVTFEVGNVYDLPFLKGSFSAVVTFDLLEHLAEPGRAVVEAWRLLKPDGRFHLFVPCEGGFNTLHGLLSHLGWRAKEHYGGHIQRYDLTELKSLLKPSGFNIRNYRWSGHLVNQTVDVMYFTILSLLGRNVPTSVEGYLESAEHNISSKLVGLVKSMIAVSSYFESRILVRVPGSGVHLLCHKDKANHSEGVAVRS